MTPSEYHQLIVNLLTAVETNAKNGHLDAFESKISHLMRTLGEYRNLLRLDASQGNPRNPIQGTS
jgi:hypothetical protein